MRWRQARRSTNIEDRRGMRMGMPVKLGGAGIVLAIIVMLLGGDPGAMLDSIGGSPGMEQPTGTGQQPADEGADFIAHVLGDTEDTWTQLFAAASRTYEPPVLVIFTDMVESACGINSAAVGPFYCPADRKVYIDLGFYRELRERFGAPGDFAQAYVIAHEVGHHVQNLLGIADRVHEQQAAAAAADANALSVRLELQADCFAGVWGHHAQRVRDLLDAGDVEEALNAAAAIGDDRIQRNAGRNASPETWTHGSSAQRSRWFRRGMELGNPDECNTFAGPI